MATITITTGDHDRTINARAGDEIVVRLPENPTTGFRWHVQTVTGPLSATGDDYTPGQEMLIGSGGIRELRFQARSAGDARLALHNWRSWEGESSITERLSIGIHISP